MPNVSIHVPHENETILFRFHCLLLSISGIGSGTRVFLFSVQRSGNPHAATDGGRGFSACNAYVSNSDARFDVM